MSDKTTYTIPTPTTDVVSPPAKTAIRSPANAGPKIRDKFQEAVLKAIALNINRSPTISGMNAVLAGIERARTVPFRNPTHMKSQNVTVPNNRIKAIPKVAAPLSICAQKINGFFFKRSANTPPNRENKICGTVKESVTHARFIAETVISYTSQPCATICIFIAKAEPTIPNHNRR